MAVLIDTRIFKDAKAEEFAPVMLLPRRDAALVLGVSVSTIDKLRQIGELPVVRLTPGGDPMYAMDDLKELVRRKRGIERQ
jgi:hypothetical protein